MVEQMSASHFIAYQRSARMLHAQEMLEQIQVASFHALKKDEDRDKIIRNLTSASKRYLFEPVKDFAEVAANFAKRLRDGR